MFKFNCNLFDLFNINYTDNILQFVIESLCLLCRCVSNRVILILQSYNVFSMNLIFRISQLLSFFRIFVLKLKLKKKSIPNLIKIFYIAQRAPCITLHISRCRFFSLVPLAIALTDFTLDASNEWTARIEYSYRPWLAERYHLFPK